MTQPMQPIFILPEDTKRTTGKNAQRNNISAARMVAETVRTTLGPKGMDKMIVDTLGDITVTNDGVTILDEMQIEHPAAKMIVEIAKTQEDEVGDGTTTAVVLAGELLAKAEDLLEQNIHPTVIAKGYRLANDKAQEVLDAIGEPINEKDTDLLKKVAMTAMVGKGAEASKELLADITVKAVKSVMDISEKEVYFDEEAIKIEKKVGGAVEDTEIIQGVVVDKEKVHSGMPRIVKNAKIVLVDSALEVKSTETDAKIQITDPSKMQAFLDMEERQLKDMVDKLATIGANVVFCQKGIDDMVQHFLAKKEIYACRRVKKTDMDNLAKATGAKVVSSLKELTSNELGRAGLIEEVKFKGGEEMTFVRDCKNPKASTILVHGGTSHVVDEVKRAIEDSVGDVLAALKYGKVAGGAGSVEIEVSRELRKYSDSLSGREQLAVNAFATALEVIPKTLAENAGLDPIDVMTAMKSAHDKNQKWAGIDVFTGKVMDAWKKGVIEPLKIKSQALSSASEVAIMILRIDDVISGGSSSQGGNPGPGGMPPGMGMPDY